MTDRTRDDAWNRHEWEGEGQGPERPAEEIDPETGPRWTKTQWVGQGQGEAEPVDPDDMAEGESKLSGDRHTSGEEHWARGQSEDAG